MWIGSSSGAFENVKFHFISIAPWSILILFTSFKELPVKVEMSLGQCLSKKQYHDAIQSSRNLETSCCTVSIYRGSTFTKMLQCLVVNLWKDQYSYWWNSNTKSNSWCFEWSLVKVILCLHSTSQMASDWTCLVGWSCGIHRLHLCRGVRTPPPPPPTRVLDMKLNNLIVRFQICWRFKCKSHLHYHRSPVHSGPEW